MKRVALRHRCWDKVGVLVYGLRFTMSSLRFGVEGVGFACSLAASLSRADGMMFSSSKSVSSPLVFILSLSL